MDASTAKAGANTGLFHVHVAPEQAGQRLDQVLAAAASAGGLALSRTRLRGLIEAGHVSVDGRPIREGKVKAVAGARVIVALPEPEPATPLPQPMPLAVVFEDEHLLILDKPAGLVVHPAAGHEDGTLVNALLAHCAESLSGIGGVKRPGIVHRLDKDTSGLMVVAKTDRAHAGLSTLFADHGRTGSLVREYVALVYGVPDRSAGTVATDLARDPNNRLRVAVVPEGRGRHAVTHWATERRFGVAAAWIRCRLETGRTHQIRVHMAAIGHPIIADPVYGTGFRTKAALLGGEAHALTRTLDRQALHAATLGFTHPVTGEPLLLTSRLPPELAALDTALSRAHC